MTPPAPVHLPSTRPYREAEPYDYSRFDDVRSVSPNGAIRFLRSTIGITAALAGHEVVNCHEEGTTRLPRIRDHPRGPLSAVPRRGRWTGVARTPDP